ERCPQTIVVVAAADALDHALALPSFPSSAWERTFLKLGSTNFGELSRVELAEVRFASMSLEAELRESGIPSRAWDPEEGNIIAT
ncbi:MAG: hypothetical protein WD648_04640, partial [Planctomycetaceae bacterium]